MDLTHSEFVEKDLTWRIIGSAIEVHRNLRPGLLENAYRECLVRELARAALAVRREVPIPVVYKGDELNCGFRADLIVQDAVVLELKAVDHLLPIHEAQLLTHLKLCGNRVGVAMNFNAASLRHGIRRLIR